MDNIKKISFCISLFSCVFQTECTEKRGKHCHFPFTYYGKTWNRCTDKTDEYDPWCPHNVGVESRQTASLGSICPRGRMDFEVAKGLWGYWGYCEQSKECSGKNNNTYILPSIYISF